MLNIKLIVLRYFENLTKGIKTAFNRKIEDYMCKVHKKRTE